MILFLVPVISLWATSIQAVFVNSPLIYQFFDNYEVVWPENANKLAFAYFSAVPEARGQGIMLSLNDIHELNPGSPPSETTQGILRKWLETTRFDPEIRYYRILKDLEEGTFEIPEEEVQRMVETLRRPTDSKSLQKDDSREGTFKGLQKRACAGQRCESNYYCLQGGNCLCKVTRYGRFCRGR